MRGLDELEILVLVDNETDTLSSVDDGVSQVPEVAHLVARTPASGRYQGHECKIVFDQLCCACHGLSVLITGRREGRQHRLLSTSRDARPAGPTTRAASASTRWPPGAAASP